MDQTNISKTSPAQKDPPKPPDPTTVVLDNKRDPPMYGGQSTNNGGMWNIKHEISSPKFYELLIKTELNGYTDLYLNNFHNRLNMCLNAVTRLR